MGYFLKKDTNSTYEGLVLPSGPTADRPVAPLTGSVRYNTDLGSIEYFDGSNYVDLAKAGKVGITWDKFTGDDVTTQFTMSQAHTAYTEVLVFIDGYLQVGPLNYTCDGSTTITFSEAPPLDRRVLVIHNLNSTYVTSGNVYDVPNL